jgi:hypothetical protein
VDELAIPGRLEWWANPSTCLGSVEVTIRVRVTAPQWRAAGRLVEVSEADLEGFRFLRDGHGAFELTELTPEGV